MKHFFTKIFIYDVSCQKYYRPWDDPYAHSERAKLDKFSACQLPDNGIRYKKAGQYGK